MAIEQNLVVDHRDNTARLVLTADYASMDDLAAIKDDLEQREDVTTTGVLIYEASPEPPD